jgi:hypothetical protein
MNNFGDIDFSVDKYVVVQKLYPKLLVPDRAIEFALF